MSDDEERSHPPSPKRLRKKKSTERSGVSVDDLQVIVHEVVAEVLLETSKMPHKETEGGPSTSGKAMLMGTRRQEV